MALRIASFLPSATDSLFSLGLINQLVASSHECDAEGVTSKALTCTESKCSFEQGGMDSEQIHFASTTSQALLWEASFRTPRDPVMIIEWMLSPYHTFSSVLEQANPDIILTQVQISTTDLQLSDIENALLDFLGHKVKVVHLDPPSLSSSLTDILTIAEACGQRRRGEDLVTNLKHQFSIAENMSSGREKCKAICLQWTKPLFSAGAWVSDLIQLAGGIDVASIHSNQSNESNQITWQAIEASSAQVLVFLICGCKLEDSVKEVKGLVKMGSLSRVMERGIQIFVTDGIRLFSRPGPSLVDSLQVLTEIFHPECQRFGHENKLWVRLELD